MAQSQLVIVIRPDGSIESLLKDKIFDTRIFGDRKIERLSEVLPTEDGQKFFIRWLQGPDAGSCIGHFDTYEEAVDYEVNTVNAKRLQGHSYTLANSPMPWCERCQSYHHHTAEHIRGGSDAPTNQDSVA